MKLIKGFFITVFFSAILFSCKKDDPASTTPANGMNAKVDGTVFSVALSATTAHLSGGSPNTMEIYGATTAGQILLVLTEYTGPGIYRFGPAYLENSASYTIPAGMFPSYSANFNGGSGELNISSDTGGFVTGTFNFTGELTGPSDIKTITEGSFRIVL